MKTMLGVLRELGARWRAWLGFELLFRTILLSLVGPLLKLSLDGAMALSGYAYLTWENLRSFALTPACIAFVLLWAVLLTLVSVFELAGLHYALALDESYGRPRIQDVVRYALGRVARAVRPANLLVIPYLSLLLPFVRVGVVAGMADSLDLPEFVLEYAEMNPLLGAAYSAFSIALTLISLLFVYSVVFFAGEDVTFVQAAREGRRAGKGHFPRDVVRFVLVPPIIIAVASLALFVPCLGLLAASGNLSLSWGMLELCGTVASLMTSVPVTYATCLVLLRMRDVKPPVVTPPPAAHAPSWAAPLALGGVLVVSVAGGTFFVVKNFVEPSRTADQLGDHVVVLTAHRGGTFGAPENTMAAFAQAKQDGADVCELDVQQSKDGVIFVSHDSNFKRISGVDKGAWELTWDEICELDATGTYWDGLVEKQAYPTLDDVIAWAKDNDMQLNIELKPTGHEKNFEKSVADIINAHDFAQSCIVTSQAYDTVARIKQYVPHTICTYVTTLAYGEVCRLDAADAFSVEETSATPALVTHLHEHNKPVLAWVVNSEASMRRMVANGVDDVITDDVPLGRAVIDEANEMSPTDRLLNALVAILS